MITAEKVYREIIEMPLTEREKLFAVIARRGFEKDLYSHNEVFDEIRKSPFTVKEAAEYLEVAEITLRRWIKAGKIKTGYPLRSCRRYMLCFYESGRPPRISCPVTGSTVTACSIRR